MPSPSSPHDPARVGRYRLLQRLGEGGMGVVHLGLDPDGRAVAIKMLRAHIAADPDARLRLAREVDTLRRVQHPLVAAVLDADVESEVPYLVTTFVPGKPLDVHVRDHGPLPRGHVARVGALLAEALQAIHRAGVVHRDLKPANVMLLDGEPVLIDFGIAHVADESRITHTGLVMGTPGYLSPEIVGGEPVTEATDWWAWGATLAFASTGRPPFGTGPVEVVLDRVRRGSPDIEGVDAGLRATLTAALSVDPLSRPAPALLVAGLAASAPARGGARRFTLPVEAATERIAWGGAATSRYPAPPRVGAAAPLPSAIEAATAVVPPPAPWGTPGRPDGRRFDRLGAPGQARPANGFDGAGRSAVDPSGRNSPVRNGFDPSNGHHRGAGPAPADWGAARPGADDPSAPTGVSTPAEPARGVPAGVLVVLAAVAAVAPYGALCITVALMVLARVVDRSSTALLVRRDQHGPRGSDGLLTVLALPWQLVGAVVSTALSLVLPVLIGVSVTFIAGGAVSWTPGRPGPLAAGMAALLLAAWFGPGGGGLRHGATRAARSAVPGRRARLAAWSLMTLLLISALSVLAGGHVPDWGPLQGVGVFEMLTQR